MGRLDQARLAALFEPPSQVLYRHVDDVRIAQQLIAPDTLEDSVPAQHPAWVTQEELQELQLTRAELHPAFTPECLACLEVERQVAERQHLVGGRRCPAQQR